MLPSKFYEGLRWTVSVVLPAISVLFATLANAWRWDVPTDEILTSISAVGLCLGTVFGISKVVNDKNN